MRQLKLFVKSLLLLTSLGAYADKVTVNTTEFEPGETIDMSVWLENTGTVSGYTMKLYLPEGFCVIYDEKKKDYVCELSDRHEKDYSMTLTKASDGSFLFVIYPSKSGDAIKGKSGLLFTAKLSVASNVTASKMARLESLAVSDADGIETALTDVVFDLTRKAPPITVTAKNYSRLYGEFNPTFGYEAAGGKLSGNPTISCEATTTSPVGDYDIVVTEGSVTSPSVTYVNGKLTVTKAPLTIMAKSYTIKQGETLPTLEVECTGFKNNETIDVLIKKPIVATTATSANEPGTYDITVTGAEAGNYEINYVQGTLTITATEPVTVTASSYTIAYGDAIPDLKYTSKGATLSGIPTISCEATSTSPVGVYPILIKKGGVTNYNDTYINGTLTIAKAPLTIKIGTYTKKQGEPLPEFTLTYEGFKNGETEAVLTKLPTVSCEATEASEPREYEVKLSGAEALNYEIDYVDGKLTVTEADPITLTAMSYTREYGEENPVFEYTSEGATLEGMPEISSEATVTSPVGTYDIVVKQGDVKNYNVTYVKGTLTITKAPLKVSVKSVEREQGMENPQFEIIYEGWKLQDNESVLTRKPVATTTATKNSPVGEYAIIVSGGEAENYELKYQDGRLTVTVPSSINNVTNGRTFDVYSVSGVLVKKNITTLKGLPKGVYIVEGKKVVNS